MREMKLIFSGQRGFFETVVLNKEVVKILKYESSSFRRSLYLRNFLLNKEMNLP